MQLQMHNFAMATSLYLHLLLQLVSPTEATDTILSDVHTQEYIDDIKAHKTKVAQVSSTDSLVCLMTSCA